MGIGQCVRAQGFDCQVFRFGLHNIFIEKWVQKAFILRGPILSVSKNLVIAFFF
jgi:hypothetical protein